MKNAFVGLMVMTLIGVTATGQAATLTVTNAADGGDGTLRQAILDANADTSLELVTITFNLPGAGVQTIAPLTPLPAITRPVTIDGYTQMGASPNTLSDGDNAVLLIQLTGTNASGQPGLFLQGGSDGSLVRGLVINGFTANGGIYILGSSSNVIAGNFIGTTATGQTNLENFDGVDIQTSSFNLIGGTTPAARNVISGNGEFGIYFYGPCASNLVQGNFIGTDVTGTNALGNVNGVVLRADAANVIGGTSAVERNIISGNSSYAISMESPGTIVQGNFIGTDVTGWTVVPNGGGISIGGSDSRIGGSATGAGNLISGNHDAGIDISTSGNIIQGNFIGVDVTGTNALGNGGFGVVAVLSASENLIGGTVTGARNVISHNFHGVGIYSGSNNVIQGNFIGTDATGVSGLGNDQFGIYLGDSAPGTLIGGTAPGAGNLVSGNGYEGIYLNSPGTIIQGNLIGTDVTGTNSMFNGAGYNGISLGASGVFTLVGGTSAAARNVISGGGGIGIYSSTNLIQGNYLGIGVDGQTIVGDPGFGIYIDPAGEGNLLGGAGVGAGNLISGWFAAIRIAGSNNVVQGNLIGTDATGTLPRSIQNYAVTIWGQNNLIGGLTPGARNVISASVVGVGVSGNVATGNTIQGNFIGTDITGANALPNYQGISIEYAPANLIGGMTSAARNVISGSSGYAIGIGYDGASNNVVQGNYIGLAADGVTSLPNYAGVRFAPGALNNLFGGAVSGAGNWVAHNQRWGVSSVGEGVTNNAILGNSIFSNGWGGIDLGEDGVTANDLGDGDNGQNHLQNFPEIISAKLVSSDLYLTYRVDSIVANSAYPLTVEFYHADASGQGKTFLFRHTYPTPQAFTDITFTPAAPVIEGDPLVATATDAHGNTSEFSAVGTVTANHPPIVVNLIPDQSGTSGVEFDYTIPANTFSDPDAGDTLSYTASGLPPDITFDGPTRSFSGTPTATGIFAVTVTATDDGTPPLSTNDVFNITVIRGPITVTNLADSGAGTLRQAIADAVPGDTIDFAVTGTIQLEGTLDVNKALTIQGPGATNLLIRGQYASRMFNITAGPTTISGVTLIGGDTSNFFVVDPEGAAIRNTAHLTLDTCAVVGNVALNQGGAVMNLGPSATLVAVNCTFADNFAVSGFVYFDGAGGAIWSDGVLRVTNCTFSGNSAPRYGGAVYSSGDTVIASSTITRNQTFHYESGAGGIYNDGGMLALQNSIVAGNMNDSGYAGAHDVGGVLTSGDYNLIQSTNGLAVPGTHNVLGIDPLLGSLRDNGGPTLTHGLASISPALDVADAATSPVTDQRGIARPQGAGFDIGAFEGALPVNHPPVVANPIAPLPGVYGDSLNYTLPADTFSDSDLGQTLTYSMAGSGIAYFIPETRTIIASFLPVGTNTFIVTATDDGAPPLSASITIELVVGKRTVTARADDQSRPHGQANPPLSITYYGLVSSPDYLANPPVATATATFNSPPGIYPILLTGGSDGNYDFIGLTNGTLTVMDFSVDYQVVRSFGFTNQMGITPTAKVIEGTDGVLYGVTSDVIYRVNRDGTGYQVLRFLGSDAPLREFSDGALYGTTQYGGTAGFGTLFKLNKDGTGFEILHNFTDEVDDGSYPQTQLLEGSDGLIYGTARRVFSMNTNGTGYTIVHRFNLATDGAGLQAPLLEGSDGALYGATYAGGQLDGGTIFKVNKDGTGFQVLHEFPFDNLYFVGAYPQGVIEGTDGVLYGVTEYGGASNGDVFKLNRDGTGYGVLHTFSGTLDGIYPQGPLVEGSDGALYGVTLFSPSFGDGILFKVNKDSSGFAVVYNFNGSGVRAPIGLTLGSDGKFYIACSASDGALLRVNQDGTGATVLWRFSSSGGDVFQPSTALVEATNGRLYGGTTSGMGFGLNKDGSSPATLPIYASRPPLLQGSDVVLYGLQGSSLSRVNLDGSGATNFFNFPPAAGSYFTSLTEGSDGDLYGTASYDGALSGGTLFKVNKDGNNFNVLHNFEYSFGVSPPNSPQYVFEASDGKLYGICASGGGSVFDGFNGSVFSVNRDGSGYTNIHVFSDNISYVNSPVGRLIEASDGRLYGTAGGAVFGLNKDGSGYGVLRKLPLQDQINPNGVTEGSDGYLYGFGTGSDPYPSPVINGSIYRLKKDGTGYCVLRRFNLLPGEASFPVGWPIQASDGAFYGAAGRGGTSAFGAIFRFVINPVLLNQRPTLDHPISDQNRTYGSAFNFTFAANTFSDPDAGQVLSYTVGGLPPGISFDAPSRTFSGTTTAVGTNFVTVTATDNGTPPLNTNDTFTVVVEKALLTVSASNTNRPYGEVNPTFTGTLVGVTNSDNLTDTFTTTAIPSSPPGDYPITPILQDPDSRLGNYIVTTNSGTLSINGVMLEIGLAGSLPSFCWPTTAATFLLEYTDDLAPPVIWHQATSGITTNASGICLTVTPEVAVPARFFRLRLP